MLRQHTEERTGAPARNIEADRHGIQGRHVADEAAQRDHELGGQRRRQGQPYTEQGFKAMWNRIMEDWLKLSGAERFTFHDLRAYYVTVMVGRGENPETHANPLLRRAESTTGVEL